MGLSESHEREVTAGHSLNSGETDHVTSRRETVVHCLKLHDISCTEDVVPNIAVLGSGGGLRAMVALLGSLCQLDKEGLLDCIMYLSGVSGSTWCMASLYKEPDWSTQLQAVTDGIVERLVNGEVTIMEKINKLVQYSKYDNFSLTHVWAVFLSGIVKELDEQVLNEQKDEDSEDDGKEYSDDHSEDPYPIYTVIDKQCKNQKLHKDVWFEITPHEAGYSLTGAFVDSSWFGSEFNKGKRHEEKSCPSIDMLYLQGLCGSALAKRAVIVYWILDWLRDLLTCKKFDDTGVYPGICILEGLITQKEAEEFTLPVCNSYLQWFQGCDVLIGVAKALKLTLSWTWGTTYNFLDEMTVKDVDPSVLKSTKREYEDAGLLLNSPYFSVLRKERKIDLIISLDFSEDDNHFKTLDAAAEKCKEAEIDFPDVSHMHDREPLDFYVFKGNENAPTVIHIPLFNAINCPGEVEAWRRNFSTTTLHYTAEMITDLIEKAELNIRNNKEKLLREIKNIIEQKQKTKGTKKEK
ncbi:cytosolic phospholipase A2 gamma-like [Trichomycterus rosablanca]|uniref:cytosolic phospholipase A2 gamma-like n=1 Tax=Trichomycterus rosablanca TaxID=2290929 RepID=UPI002F35174C